MNLSDLAHAVALRELARSKVFDDFLSDALTAFSVGVLAGAYVGVVVYCVASYLELS